MQPDYITYSHKSTDHPDFQKTFVKHQVNKELQVEKRILEDEINLLIFEFEKRHQSIVVNFEKSNIIRPYPSKERINVSLFIDFDLLLCDNELHSDYQ